MALGSIREEIEKNRGCIVNRIDKVITAGGAFISVRWISISHI